MCFSKPPKVKPIAAAPTASPEIIDDVAVTERNNLLRKRRLAFGRQSTIMAGGDTNGAAPATAPVKVALGS